MVSTACTKHNPCRDCTSRHPACHDSCDARKQWIKLHQKEVDARRKAKLMDSFTVESILRIHPEKRHAV